jgi:hypothetical protein
MKRHTGVVLTVIILLAVLPGSAGPIGAQSGAPTVVSYQGQVTVGGTPFTGTGYFKFAVVDASGGTVYWSNQPMVGGQPSGAVSLSVSNGLFNVLLGDTSLPKMSALPATAFDGTARYLRVWFMEDGGSSFIQLSPDRRIAAVPYALQAEEAKNAGTAGDADTLDGQHASAFWNLAGNAGTNPASQFLGTTDAQPLVLRTNNTEQARLDPAGNLGLGTTTPSERLTVRGNARVLGEDNPAARGSVSTNLQNAQSVFVAGRYAYVASFGNGRLAVFDVSDPAAPVALGFTSTNLSQPYSVVVAGRYAYVASYANDRLVIFDVSDPTNLVAKGYTSANLDAPTSVVVAGRYAYVGNMNNSTLAVFDVSVPSNPVARGYTSTNLQAVYSVFVAGRYAYVASKDNSHLAVFDVSDPDNPVARGYTSDYLDGPVSVHVVGDYAYVASDSNSRLVIVNVSDPDAPVGVGYTNAGLSGGSSVVVAGDYAYVTSPWNNRLAVFDVSNPASIVAKGSTSTNLNQPTSVFVAGRYAYTASYLSPFRLAVFELNHLQAPTGAVGSLQAGNLAVANDALVGNGLRVQGGLNVGPGGALVGGDLSVEGDLFAHVRVTGVTGATALTVDQAGVVLVNNPAACAITLPAAASAEGVTFTIKHLTANQLGVNAAGGTIDGVSMQSLNNQYDFITVVSDGANWYIIGR